MPVETQQQPEGNPELEEIRKALRGAQEKEDAAICERWRALHTADSRTETVSGATNDTTLSRDSYYESEVPSPLSREGGEYQQQAFVGESVVLYNEGATPLFRSIEESDWDGAAKILEEHPEQASVWVESTGTVSTTFNWSLWKRLPLHEAARRQPPERFLAKLIQAFPAAASRPTQFGELPLHLAVECGAEPCIVNLLALHHWPGVVQADQSGRVALDILLEAAILDPVERTVVHESLKASMATHTEFCRQQDADLEAVEKQHRVGLRALRRKFDADLKLEQSRQETLKKEIEALKRQLREQHEVIQSQNTAIARYKSAEEVWNNRFAQSESRAVRAKELYRQEQVSTSKLVETVAGRDDKIADLMADLEQCKTTAARIHMVQRKKVSGLVSTIQSQLEGTLSKMEVLDQTLADQTTDLHQMFDENLLIDELASLQLTSTSESGAEDDVVDEEALRRAAQAASDVLS